MTKNELRDPFERILKASNRTHLDNAFRSSDDLRTKHFPGAGGKPSQSRLIKAYLEEFDDPTPDWQLLAHGTWPWLMGHAHDLISLTDELKRSIEMGELPLDASKRKAFVKRFSESGTAEIEVFCRIFGNGGAEFQKAVLGKLQSEPPRPPAAAIGVPAAARPAEPVEKSESRPVVEDLDPITRAKMAWVGTLFFLALSLIPLSMQFWRQPDQDHWIVLSVSGSLAMLTVGFGIDYARKRP